MLSQASATPLDPRVQVEKWSRDVEREYELEALIIKLRCIAWSEWFREYERCMLIIGGGAGAIGAAGLHHVSFCFFRLLDASYYLDLYNRTLLATLNGTCDKTFPLKNVCQSQAFLGSDLPSSFSYCVGQALKLCDAVKHPSLKDLLPYKQEAVLGILLLLLMLYYLWHVHIGLRLAPYAPRRQVRQLPRHERKTVSAITQTLALPIKKSMLIGQASNEMQYRLQCIPEEKRKLAVIPAKRILLFKAVKNPTNLLSSFYSGGGKDLMPTLFYHAELSISPLQIKRPDPKTRPKGWKRLLLG